MLEDPFELQIASDKDFLATHVSYKLDLRGPSLDVQSACSTSLVAIHLACQALLAGECDMALAGGVGVRVPHHAGYLYRPGSILSPDGHCRPFDARAAGTAGGSGLGVVVLKRLSEALEAGDTIHAVVCGSAVNNDGATKVGYAAPSVAGQADVVRAALGVAGLEAASVGYIEAHGTGTLLGDPIEVAALKQVFRGVAPASCALGSIKSNLGHLDAAAGVAGFIKAALAVREGRIPASLHFEQPNPHLGLEGSPFYVSTTLGGWPIGGTRRAGVSSFGIGGTNVHVVIEEPPARAAAPDPAAWTLLPLSARSPEALEAMAARLADQLKKQGGANIDDIGYTLAVGRRAFDVRRVVVARRGELDETISALEGLDRTRVVDGRASGPRPVVFMFPGQGAQHVEMAVMLYRSEPVFSAIVDECASHLRGVLGFDLRELLYPSLFPAAAHESRDLAQTGITQPAVFVTSYALASTLLARGVTPAAMIGHSIGEYVAACLAGVLSLPDALALVATRGQLMQRLPTGAMLAVSLDEAEAEALVGGVPGLAIAASNGPRLTVIAGPAAAIDALAAALASRGIGARRLITSHAFHSEMMEAAVGPLVAAASRTPLQAPAVPYVSNVSGTWISDAEATDPAYYGRHLRRPVRFGAGLRQILTDEPDAIVLEVGPGQTLTTLARVTIGELGSRARAVASLAGAKQPANDATPLATILAQLWTEGASIDVAARFAGQARRRVPLPTYPFERQRYWIEPGAQPAGMPGRAPELRPHAISWTRTAPLRTSGVARRWLVVGIETQAGAALLRRIAAANGPADGIEGCAGIEDIARVVSSIATPDVVAVVGPATSIASIVHALRARSGARRQRLGVITSGLHAIQASDVLVPGRAGLVATCRDLARAHADLGCTVIDLPPIEHATDPAIHHVIGDLDAASGPETVVLRGRDRWALGYTAANDDDDAGGLGDGVILVVGDGPIAQQLARRPGMVLATVEAIAIAERGERVAGVVYTLAARGSAPDAAAELEALEAALDDRALGFCVVISSPLAAEAITVEVASRNAHARTPWTVWQCPDVMADELAIPEATLDRMLARAGRGEVIAWASDPGELRTRATVEPSPPTSATRHPRPVLDAAYAAPDGEVEHQLCEIWQDMLGVEPIGVHDNFMALGGHSLLGVRLAARLRTTFRVDLPLQVMFDSPTVAELALAVESAVIAELEAQELHGG